MIGYFISDQQSDYIKRFHQVLQFVQKTVLFAKWKKTNSGWFAIADLYTM
jgi:hypothetical protein